MVIGILKRVGVIVFGDTSIHSVPSSDINSRTLQCISVGYPFTISLDTQAHGLRESCGGNSFNYEGLWSCFIK